MRVIFITIFIIASCLFSSEKIKTYFDIGPAYFEYSDFYPQQNSKKRRDINGLGVDASILKPSSKGSDFYLGMGAGAILKQISPLFKDSYNVYHLRLMILEYNFQHITVNGDISIHHLSKNVPTIGKSYGTSIFYNYSESKKFGLKFQEGRVDADPDTNVEKYPISDFRFFSLIARFLF